MKATDSQLGQAFLAARAGEVALRQAAAADLRRQYGPTWHSQIPEGMLSDWKSRQEGAEAGGHARGADPIDYATIDELAGLINKLPEVFEPRFGKSKLIQNRIGQFRVLRNALMHGAELSQEDCENIVALSGELVSECTAEVVCTSIASNVTTWKTEQPRSRTELTEAATAFAQIVAEATQNMSGMLTGERDALTAFLRDNLTRSSPLALSHVHAKFAALPGTSALVDQILQELPPPRPSAPNPDGRWKPKEWLNWVTRNYMPYKRWLIKNGQDDQEMEAMSLAFEDWLRQSYPQLLLRSHDNLVVGTYQWIRQQLDRRMRVVWLVVDNLSLLWLPEFVRALEDAGLQISETRRMLAMLPTTTQISRRSMLAGRLPVDAGRFASEQDACHQLWCEQGIERIKYCTSFSEAESAAAGDADLIILVNNRLDALAHEASHPGFDREEEMTIALESLAVKLGTLMRKMRLVGSVKLMVSTDHGCTLPSASSVVISVPPSALPDDDSERYRRVSPVGDTSGLNSIDWHVLDAQSYGLSKTYAVARGQRFIGARPKAYTHGGLTPEESVVMLLAADVGERKDLDVVLSQSTPPLRLGRPGTLGLLVRNPFDAPIENLQIAIPALGVQFDVNEVPSRSEARTSEQEVTLPPKLDVHEGAVYLTCAGQYYISGRPALVSSPIKLNVRLLYQSSMDDLEELL